MAKGRTDAARLVELAELGVEVDRGLEGEHRPLAADDDDGREAVEIDLVDPRRGLDELQELRVVLVATADDVLGLPPAGVLGVAHGVGLTPAAERTEQLDVV